MPTMAALVMRLLEGEHLLQQHEERETDDPSRFMTPPKNRSPISSQQHPRQKAPRTSPIRSAPATPGRQWSEMKRAPRA
jgi:hypothetical protein